MSRYGAWIGGAVGWALGGPIGGILGFAFGKMFTDNSLSVEGQAVEGQQKRNTRNGDFGLSLLVLSAAVMQADERVLKSELAYVQAFLRNNFGPGQAEQFSLMLRDLLKQPIEVQQVAEQVRRNMELPKRLLLVQYLYGIAQSDGQIHSKEIDIIRQIAGWLAITSGDLLSIEEMFRLGQSNPYTILEISSTASDSEIKKAYRKLVVKFHPDKVMDLGETHRKQARERFESIQAAYEQIKDERGMK